MKIKLLCLTILFSYSAFSQLPGDLDSTFSSDGKFSTPIGTANGLGRSLALQPDGKIVIAAYCNNGTNNDFGVLRVLPEGVLDSTFGSNGIVTTDISSDADFTEAVAIDADGKIVVGGYSTNSNGFDFAATRYLPDGTLDSTFAVNGKLITLLGSTSFCKDIAIQTDGKIILGGYTFNNTSNEFALVRVHPDGGADSSFNATGQVLIGGFTSGSAVASSMVIQDDQKIILAGQSFNDTTLRWEIAVARVNADGSPDSTFGGDGKVVTATGNIDNTINAVALQEDGKIIVAGFRGTSTGNNNFTLARYNTNGSLDSIFGTDGILVINFGTGNNQANALAVQPDGKIIVAGNTLIAGGDNFAIARLTTEGDLDTSFGNGGKVTTLIGSNDGIRTIALQPDGKLVVSGTTFHGTGFNVAVARYETGLIIPDAIDEPELLFSGMSVYPCPAKQSVVLSYSLREETSVCVQLFDIKGSFVAELLSSETQLAGQHEQTIFLPASLAAGFYFISLNSANQLQALKILVAK